MDLFKPEIVGRYPVGGGKGDASSIDRLFLSARAGGPARVLFNRRHGGLR